MEPIILASHIRAPYEMRGTLDDWRNDAGRLAKGHRLATLAISTAFASPLLCVGGYESGGVHVHGRSSIGKTSSLRLAASVWGRGTEGGNLRSWRSTANALEATLAGACDVGLVIDEIGQIDERDLGAALYMTANGVGKQRMRADASLRDAYSWRLLVLSSGEDPIETKLNEDKKRNVRAGQLARMLDVPVSMENGAFGDELTDFDGGAFAAECTHAATTAYGTAGPEFVRKLFRNSLLPDASDARDKVRNAVDTFVSEIVLRLDGQTLRAAQRFGLIALAGELAIEYGIVPWDVGSAREAARWAFDRWLGARGGVIAYEAARAVAQVRHFIEAHGDSRFEDLDLPSDPDRKPMANRAGFREGKGEIHRWYAYPEVWRTEICAGLDAHDVAKTLADLSMLEPGADKLAKPKKVGGKAQRFYTLTPRILDGWGEQE